MLLALALVPACSNDSTELRTVKTDHVLTLSSPAFGDHEAIPERFTCDGEGSPPPLRWTDAPDAGEYAVTVVDPDAPGGSFVHWVVWRIPASATTLGAGLPDGAVEGTNDFGDVGYGAPCPPAGDDAHRYVFTVYAVESRATDGLADDAGAQELLDAIDCCAIAGGSLTGEYGRR